MSIINIENFFDFDYTGPTNRIAYSKEDAEYKLKCIKSMQNLGMYISIDKAGNICGRLPGDFLKKQSLVIGSHTDSVKDGGQFDGPVGVYMALKAIENFKNSNKSNQYGNIKAVIYACEESTRFSKACIGSSYLSDELTLEKLNKLKDKNGNTFPKVVSKYITYLFSHFPNYGINPNHVSFTDKVLTQSEISEAIESHIEQAEILYDSNISIGAVDSIGKPLRGDITVDGKNSILTASRIITEFNKLANETSNGSEENIRITFPKFETTITPVNSKTIKPKDSILLKINSIGEHNHSGSTPPAKRKDAVLGLANLILELDKLQKNNPKSNIKLHALSTPNWGANQIQNNASLILEVKDKNTIKSVQKLSKQISEKSRVNFQINTVDSAEVSKDNNTNLFIDVRQQYPATGNNTRDILFETFKKVQQNIGSNKDSIGFNITSKGNPIRTSTELLEDLKNICDEKNYPCQIMHSWPGHDLACVLAPNHNGKRVLFFIPSKGGSHNPAETTSKEAISIGTDVYSSLVSSRMRNFEKQYENQKEI